MSTTGLHELTTDNQREYNAPITLSQYIQNQIGQQADHDLNEDVHHVRQLPQWITNPVHYEVVSSIFTHAPTLGLIAAIDRNIETRKVLYDQAATTTLMIEQAAIRIIHLSHPP